MTAYVASQHGPALLPKVRVDAYNAELRDNQEFVGDRANTRAFQKYLEQWRERVRRVGPDPFSNMPTCQLYKDGRTLQEILTNGDYKATGTLFSAVEDYAQQLASVVRCLLKLNAWQDTETIVVGGGFRAGRIGEIAIARASAVLESSDLSVNLVPTHHHPDVAGLIGSIYLAPAITADHDGILAVDVGGTNIRTGIVARTGECLPGRKAWRHADDSPKRDEAVEHLAAMLLHLSRRAMETGFRLAPFVGVGCPGIIRDDGRIERGAQNLPGDWEAADFNFPRALTRALSALWRDDVRVLLHNDAVLQGLSELPFMDDVQRWGVITIGTGFGNARLSRRTS
jgi:ROK family